MSFKVPDRQIRKYQGRIYGAGAVIDCDGDPAAPPAPKPEPVQEKPDKPQQSSKPAKKKSKRKKAVEADPGVLEDTQEIDILDEILGDEPITEE